jgi:hypothetical protein
MINAVYIIQCARTKSTEFQRLDWTHWSVTVGSYGLKGPEFDCHQAKLIFSCPEHLDQPTLLFIDA